MDGPVVLLAGPIAVGKSTLAAALASPDGAAVITARRVVEELTGVAGASRGVLQAAGREIDARTRGRWLGDYLADRRDLTGLVVVDSVRTVAQAEHVRRIRRDVALIYLDATQAAREARYGAADDPVKTGIDFEVAMAHQTEVAVAAVAASADLVIDTTSLSASQVADAARRVLTGMGC